MTVGIIGIGFVGDAMHHSFIKLGIPTKPYDRYKNIGKFEDVLDTKIVFLCLPTLFNPETSEYDKSALHEICKLLKEHQYHGLVVIKSTVEPNTSETLAQKYNLKIVHNPEFLTARTARIDFHNQKHIVLGKTSIVDSDSDLQFFYEKYYPNAEISFCTSLESESMKIFCNSFYAQKVQIFTEFYLLCQKNGSDFNRIHELMLKNGWIHPMHTKIPGPDGNISYGGACFPKDTKALLHYMKDIEVPHEVLDACVREREKMRDD